MQEAIDDTMPNVCLSLSDTDSTMPGVPAVLDLNHEDLMSVTGQMTASRVYVQSS
jgi:hypothetical protein